MCGGERQEQWPLRETWTAKFWIKPICLREVDGNQACEPVNAPREGRHLKVPTVQLARCAQDQGPPGREQGRYSQDGTEPDGLRVVEPGGEERVVVSIPLPVPEEGVLTNHLRRETHLAWGGQRGLNW